MRSRDGRPPTAPPSGRHPALLVRGLTKVFGAQRALDSVDLTVEAGEIHALVGHNGSGKSTLVKILAGYHQPEPGACAEVAGRELALGSAEAARAAGLRFVHQNLGLVGAMTVSDNFRIAGGGRWLAPLRRRAERAAARRAVAAIGYDISPTAAVADLTEAERTAVAVARALEDFDGVPLLVLDEPTASLSAPEVERLFAAIRRVADDGTAILFVSHHLDEVLGLADTVTVLRDGRRVATRPARGLGHDELVELMLGRRLLDSVATKEETAAPEAAHPRMVVSDLRGRTVAGLDLDVRAGEILGVAGLTGSGREEVASLLCGRLPRGGEMTVDGVPVPPGDPHAAVNAGIAYVPADRADATMPRAPVRENLTLADLAPFWRGGRLRRGAEQRESERWIRTLDVRPAHPERSIAELSGGNQQKVVLARWLRTAPSVLVLDEPTQGVDVGSKADIHRLIDDAAAAGTAVVICSTDDDELARLATEVIVMRRGKASVRLTRSEASSERIEQEQLASEGLVLH